MRKTCIKCHSVLTDICLPDDADELCQSCAIVVDDDDRITVELESPVGPRLLADVDATTEEIEAAIPDGWTLDWASGVRTDSGRTSFALVRASDDDDDDDDE